MIVDTRRLFLFMGTFDMEGSVMDRMRNALGVRIAERMDAVVHHFVVR